MVLRLGKVLLMFWPWGSRERLVEAVEEWLVIVTFKMAKKIFEF